MLATNPSSDLEQYSHDGDPEAFNRLVDAHQNMVLATAMRVLGDQQLAEDVVQDTFFALARQAQSIHKHVASWLHSTARNRALDLLRSEIARRKRENEQPLPNTTDQSAQQWHDLIDECLDELPSDEKELLLQRYIKGHSKKHVASQFGISDVALGKRERKILSNLRNNLQRKSGRTLLPALLLSLLGEMHAAAATGPVTATTSAIRPFWSRWSRQNSTELGSGNAHCRWRDLRINPYCDHLVVDTQH